MANKSPAFQFYPDLWLSSAKIAFMTMEQEAGYHRLICHDWLCDGLEDDDKKLAVLSNLREGWFKGGSTKIRPCFVTHPSKPGFITNPRLLVEREKQRHWIEKSREGGLKSAAKRGCDNSRVVQPPFKRTVEPKANSPSPSPSPSPNNKNSSGHPEIVEGRDRQLEAMKGIPQPTGPLQTPKMIQTWCRWLNYLEEKGQRLSITSLRSLLNKVEPWGPEEAVAALEDAMSANRFSVFKAKPSDRSAKIAVEGRRPPGTVNM